MNKLQEMIENNRTESGRIKSNTALSYNGIAKMIDVSYRTAIAKCENSTFTIHEALYIYQKLYPNKYAFLESLPEFQEFLQHFIDKEDLC